jgi:hypothetical protein
MKVNIHVMLLENTSIPAFSYRGSEIVYVYTMKMLNHIHIQFLFDRDWRGHRVIRKRLTNYHYGTVFVEKLIMIIQLFSASHGTPRYTTMFTRSRYWSLS